MSKFLHFFSFLILIFINIELRSQSSIYNDYGKNRIQFKLFKWKYLSSENFNIYYHDNGKRYAEIAIKELENNFNSITNFIGHYPNSKTKIFIFNSASDLNQSNLGINEKEVFLTTNIQTNIKLEFTTFFPGTIQNFLNKLKYDFSNSLINDMMNSEKSFTQRFGKSSSIYLPKWFTNGASKYLAEGWSQEMDNYMRDYFLISDFKKITKITENQAPIIGQSIWNYIINTYGKSSVSNVFNLSKIIRNTPRSFESTLGISFNVLLKNWQDYYIDNSKELISQYELPDRENEIKHKKDDINSTQTKLSPEGNKILYSIKDDNKQKVFIKNLINNKIEKIYSGSNNLTNNYPILNWIDNDKVGIITYYKKENILLIYDFSNKRKEIKKLQNIDQINSFNFNSSSNLLVISASSKGKSDLYLLSTYKNYIKKITNDKWDDIDPVFIPDQDIILFSSNRKSPFLDDRDYSIKQIKDDNYNIFLYHLDTTKLELKQITKTVSKDSKPFAKNVDELFYLSDIKGISNIFKYDLRNESFFQISNFFSDVLDYDVDFEKNILIASLINEGSIKNYYYENFNFNDNVFTLETNRKKFLIKKNLLNKNLPKIDYNYEDDSVKIKEDIDYEDVDNFIFEQENSYNNVSSIISNYKKFQRNSNAYTSHDYKYSIIKNNFNSFLFIDPIKGFGNKIEVDIIDLFENHKLYTNAYVPFRNLKSPDIFVEYSYLKRRTDFKLGFKRKLIFLENDEEYLYHKYQYNSIFLVSSYPISRFSRIEISPEYNFSQFNDLDYRVVNTSPLPHLTESKFNYIGIKTRFIFDNTKKIAMNLQQGTKLKIGIDNYNSTKAKEKNFNKLFLDINHYQKIHKEITLASNLYYGNFFGNNPKYFLLGGVQNSLFSKKEENAKYDPLKISSGLDNSDVLYAEFHNLRGYNYNKFQGNKILKFTTELRIPIVKYLFNREVSSSFLQNLQLISFFDIGSSWTGKSPFNTENSINIWVINDPGSVFDAEVVNSKNPWLSSFGWGVQSLIMDYYVKIDFAKPIEDYKIGKPKLHFSLGYSF